MRVHERAAAFPEYSARRTPQRSAVLLGRPAQRALGTFRPSAILQGIDYVGTIAGP